MGKKIVSYALFGENTRYAEFLPAVLRAHHSIFPMSEGWTIRIHHDEFLYSSNYGRVLRILEEKGVVELRLMLPLDPGETRVPLCKAMLWRLAPLFDKDVDAVFCRDIDALPMPRDKACMEAFLASDCLVHAVHDHPLHDGIMGGLSGFKGELRQYLKMPALTDFYDHAGQRDWSRHGADQDALNLLFAGYPQFQHYHAAPRGVPLIAAPTLPSPDDARDQLAPFLGAAGFEVAPAVGFYEQAATRLEMHGFSSDFVVASRAISTAEDDALFARLHGCAVIACDLNSVYSFFLPMTAAFWQRLGYDVMCLLVGEPREWCLSPRHKLEVRALLQRGALVRWVPRVAGHQTATTAQLARLFAGNLKVFHDGDTLITSDADMWPLGTWIGSEAPVERMKRGHEPKSVQIYYANAYRHDPSYPAPAHYPMCYMAMPAATWRTVMGTPSFEAGLREALESLVRTRPEGARPSDWEWNYDEVLLSQRLSSWSGYPDQCVFVNRDFNRPGEGRIDRGGWPAVPSFDGAADAHLIRPGYTDENWPRITPLIERAFGPRAVIEWDDYRNKYARLAE